MICARLDLSKRKFWRKRLRRFGKVVRHTGHYLDQAMLRRDQFGLMVDFMRCCHKWYEFTRIAERRPWLLNADTVLRQIGQLAESVCACETIYEVIDRVTQLAPSVSDSLKKMEYVSDWTGAGNNGETANYLRRLRTIPQHRFDWCEVPDDYFVAINESDDLVSITQVYLERMYKKLLVLMEPLANQAYARHDYQARFDFNCQVIKNAYEKELKHERDSETGGQAARSERNPGPVAAHEQQLAG